jgi:hypothetical protein
MPKTVHGRFIPINYSLIIATLNVSKSELLTVSLGWIAITC